MNTAHVMNAVRIEPIKPHIGGIVHVEKEHLLDAETITAVREALDNRGVLVFARLNLTDAEQLAFTDRLGKRVNFTRKAPGAAPRMRKMFTRSPSTRRSTTSRNMCWAPSSGTSME